MSAEGYTAMCPNAGAAELKAVALRNAIRIVDTCLVSHDARGWLKEAAP